MVQPRSRWARPGQGRWGAQDQAWAGRASPGAWVPEWAQGTDMWRDFIRDIGTMPNPTDTHAQDIFVPDGLGGWVTRATNVLSRGPLGVQTVPTRTNLVQANILNSHASILLTGSTLTDWTAGDSPANDNNAKRITQGAGATDTVGRAALACTADTYYTYSQSFKYDGSATWVRVVFSDNVANGWQCWINVQTKTIGTVNVFGAAVAGVPRIVLESGGWFRLEFPGKCTGAVASGTMASISVTGDGVNTRAAGTYGIWAPQFELGRFATPAILTSGAAVTRNANRQVVSGLGAQLAAGVAGFIKFDLRHQDTALVLRVINVSDGTASNRFFINRSGTDLAFQVDAAGVAQANMLLGPVASGIQTAVFACGPNFAKARLVGGSDPAADTSVTWPAIDRFGIGGYGYADDSATNYQIAQKIALEFGAQSQTTFDDMYAKAAFA